MQTREEFINEMVENSNKITTSDLQGIIEARCMKTGKCEEELLKEIYSRI